jgi:rSAM/selenodomain-associated transferase 1
MNQLSAAALVVFCRRPAPGNGKQRLARVLGATQAFAIASALLECTLEDAAAWPGDLIISPASREDTAWAGHLLARPACVQPQAEGNLGQRLNAVDAALRAGGAQRVIFIGTDAPSLTIDDLLAAAEALERADVVLAPATDGGVTLMGSKVAWPGLSDLPWSEPTLGNALEERCRDFGLSVVRTRGSYDVDELSDLVTARGALAGDNRPARRRLHKLVVSMAVSAAS